MEVKVQKTHPIDHVVPAGEHECTITSIYQVEELEDRISSAGELASDSAIDGFVIAVWIPTKARGSMLCLLQTACRVFIAVCMMKREQNWNKIVTLVYANKRRESMLVLAPCEFNSDRLVETFDDADEGIMDFVARENFHQHVLVDCVKCFD